MTTMTTTDQNKPRKRKEVRGVMREWAEEIFAGRYSPDNRWAQPFAGAATLKRTSRLWDGGRWSSRLPRARLRWG